MEILSIKVLILISVFKLKAVTASANQNLIFPLEKSLGKHGNQTYISSNLQNRSRLTDVENQLNGYRGGEGTVREFGMDIHTAIFKMDTQQGLSIWHMELCSMSCAKLDRRVVWGRNMYS